ncbi:MAG: hypothetical protein AAFZ92_01680 [Pseudomonadota bacterium]
MKILISMLHVVNHGGAAMVMLEFAEQFRREGHDVDMCTWWSGSPMSDYFLDCGVRRIQNLNNANPFDYDIVFFLHQNAPLHFKNVTKGQKEKTLILFFRLSHSSNIGVPAPIIDQLIMDKTLVNSEEVFQRMVNDFGLPLESIDVFNNASPPVFSKPIPKKISLLKKVLYVSNHQNQEVIAALKILRDQYGVKTFHIGEGGDKSIRVTPDVIEDADVVITMAKTAQYALLSRKPLYVYDYEWGGPGYMDEDNFDAASSYNFSGSYKPCNKSPSLIAKEIFEQYEPACDFVYSIPSQQLDPYRLEKVIEHIYKLYRDALPNDEKIKRLQDNYYLVKRERCYAEQFYKQYRKNRAAGNKLSKIRQVLN